MFLFLKGRPVDLAYFKQTDYVPIAITKKRIYTFIQSFVYYINSDTLNIPHINIHTIYRQANEHIQNKFGN